MAQQNLKLTRPAKVVGAYYSHPKSSRFCAGEQSYFEPPRNHLSQASPNTTINPLYTYIFFYKNTFPYVYMYIRDNEYIKTYTYIEGSCIRDSDSGRRLPRQFFWQPTSFDSGITEHAIWHQKSSRNASIEKTTRDYLPIQNVYIVFMSFLLLVFLGIVEHVFTIEKKTIDFTENINIASLIIVLSN